MNATPDDTNAPHETGALPLAARIWDMKYRLKGADGAPIDADVEATWRRIARSLAAPEPESKREVYEAAFLEALRGYCFLPAGRILAGAGAERNVTLFNCFVMGTVPDDMGGIFEQLKEAALTMQAGGGIGYDFSTLRPNGARVRGVGADASGPLTFMDVWDAMCRTIMSAGHRRGAMMATMRCDHPDIEAFIEAKQTPGRLRMFNLSVLATDRFMGALENDEAWELKFEGVVYKTLRARELWERIMRATYAYAEPGVIFIDRVNARNNLHYCEHIQATNPCGEQPLPPYGACLLGSVNLARFVHRPFEPEAALDTEAFDHTVETAVRMLDNVIEVSRFPLEMQAAEARAKRRIGLGVTGLADALIFCGVRYGSERAVSLTREWLARLQRSAYLASIRLAKEKGAFPLYEREPYLAGETVAGLDADIREGIAANGIRNALLTSIAPTGTISVFAGNVSSGIEPVFALTHIRQVRMPNGEQRPEPVTDYALRAYRRFKGEDAPLPDYFVDAQSLSPHEHVRMQAAAQAFIDSSISKTINVPEGIDFEAFKDVYREAYETGCKGCTTYRPNDVTGAVLEVGVKPDDEQLALPLPAVAPEHPESVLDGAGVVQMTRPLDRPESVGGRTYKMRWADSEHAIYITVNDIVREGRRAPFEIFINSKNMEHYAWTVALTRMMSAVFRRGGDVAFVVEELKAVFDPRGGQWMKGRYVPSLLAAIGEVVERHLIDIGFIASDAQPALLHNPPAPPVTAARHCPKCSHPGLIRQEGCDLCLACGYSKC